MDRLPPSVRPMAQRVRGLVLMTSLLGACVCLLPRVAFATTTTVTITADSSITADGWIREDSTTTNYGTSVNERVRTSTDGTNRKSVIRIPLSGLAGKTVLQAWLDLKQTSATSATPIDARIYPLTEAFSETYVSWANRDRNVLLIIPTNVPWSTPGGTHASTWTDRQLLSTAGNSKSTRFQVGPIVQAWNAGTLTNNGFVLEPVNSSPSREVIFDSSDRPGSGRKPSLIIQVTDSPPAISKGTAEIQPRVVHTAGQSVPMTAWLDVDALGVTPSGTPTGFDQLIVTHNGGLTVTGVDSLRVGAATFPGATVSWTNAAQTVTFQLPHLSLKGTVKLSFRANILASASAYGLDLPMTIDDSATSGASAQTLWSGNADGTAGNGDNWITSVISTPAVAIDLTPVSAQVQNHTCVQFDASLRDASGNVFTMAMDSVVVRPSNMGTVGANLLFCPTTSGTAKVIACYGALRDTATIVVLPDRLTEFAGLTVRALDGSAATALVPGDTMFVDVSLSDGNGLKDVQSMQFDVLHVTAGGTAGAAAFGGSFAWSRTANPVWSVVQPLGTSWRVIPALCDFDSSSNSTAVAVARLAFVVGNTARASSSGEWSVRARATSQTPPDVADTTLSGLSVPVHVTIAAEDAAGDFGAGAPGTARLPLSSPPDGQLHFKVLTNSAFGLEAMAGDLVGVTNPLDTLHVGSPQNRLRWSPTTSPADGGFIDTTWTALLAVDAPDDDAAQQLAVRLWIDYPLTMSQQDYLGTLAMRAHTNTFDSDPTKGELKASVVTSGLAAQLAIAEVLPHQVKAGVSAQPLTALLQPLPHNGDTGVDRVRVGIPTGWGTPVVGQVRVGGMVAAFTDLSVNGLADITLASKVTLGQLIELDLKLDTPPDLDPAGAAFVVGYDDQGTAIAPQTAAEGDANGISDGNNWLVQVTAGDLAGIAVAPATATVVQGRDTTFVATGLDALGHRLAVSPAWRVEGGIGSIGSTSGAFTATSTGIGRVIAESGGFADTATVTVNPAPGISLRSVHGPDTVVQGEQGAAFSVTLTNAADQPVRIDTLVITFGRAVAGDADADFTLRTTPPVPLDIPAGATVAYAFTADVGLDALAAPLSVQARASGLDAGSGQRYSDAAADTAWGLSLLPGGVEWTASQSPASIRPGAVKTPLMTLHVANQYPDVRTLDRLVLTNTTSGPGAADDRDDELGHVYLYRDNGSGVFEANLDTLVLQSAAFGGTILFSPINVAFGAQSTTTLFAVIEAPLSMHDGDLLDVSLAAAADASILPAPATRNGWPVTASGGLTVDGMVAAQITVTAVGPATLNPGAKDRLAFEALLPANGYASDVLTRLSMGNAGTAQPEDDIQRLRAWIDDGDGTFSKAADALLGTLAYTGGGRWQLTGLTRAIPLAGARLFVTVDAAATAAQNATIKLFLPSSPDPGVGMSSGNNGPLDAAVTNPSNLSLSDADRIALNAIPLASGTARPGARQLPLLGIIATNTYTVPRTLTTLVFDNITSGPGSQPELDGEARLLTLRADGNNNGTLEGTDVDPVLSTGFFSNGQAAFVGLSVALPPGANRQLFLTADLSTSGARDGDAVAARVTDANGIDFSEATSVAGNWPLDSGARWTVDGMTAAQIANLGAGGATVGPGDGPLLALDMVIPRNGYAGDLLRGMRIVNFGTAGAGDLSLVQLWRDGGDGQFTGNGDDVLLGPLTNTGAEWTSPLLSTPVNGPGMRVFVSVNIAAAAAETTTVRFGIPVGGVEYESTNDGPLDAAVANADEILISSSPLLATMVVPRASVVGQNVAVRMIVRNTSNETVRNVAAAALDLSGTAPFTYVSGPTPSVFDIAPATVDTIVWMYRADGTGDARFADVAGGTGFPSNLPRNAPKATSNAHRVYLAAQQLDLTPVQTMPIRVNRGQAGVVPFSLTLVHPGGVDASDVRVDRLHIRLEEETGVPIVPSTLLNRVEVNEGTNVYLVKTGIESSGSDIDLVLATPVTVTGTQPATISLRLGIDPATVVPTFRVIFDDSTRIGAQDATSGVPVTVRLDGLAYPLRSEVASIVAEATELDAAALGPDTSRTSPGQPEATLMRVRLVSPGLTGITSNVRVTSMSVALTDSAGADLVQPGLAFTEVRLKSGAQVIGRRAIASTDGDSLTFAFAPPIEVAANVPYDLTLVGDVAATAAFGHYGARLLDSTRVDARDVNTRARIAAKYATPLLRGGTVIVEGPADTLRARDHSRLPGTIVIGESDIVALAATLRHPGGAGVARVRVDGLSVQLLDDLRRPLVPRGIIGRLRVTWNGVDQADLSLVPASGDRIPVTLTGLLLEPGDTARIEVHVDIDAAAPAGFLELAIPLNELVVRDANTGLATTLVPEAGTLLPLHSGLGRLTSPARDLAVGMTSLMPAALAGDARPVPVARMTFRNTDEQGVGPIDITGLTVRGSDRLGAPTSVGAVASRLEAWIGGALWASSAPLDPDSTTARLTAAQRMTVGPGVSNTIELRMITRSGAVAPSVRLGADRTDIGVVQPASALLAINVGAEAGQSFPMWTQAGVLAEASLEASYVNFPNPFAAGHEATTIAYYMPTAGRVTLRVLTPRGDVVTTLLDGAARGIGQQQLDRWDGRNGRGDVVVNGVYIAEISISFDDGVTKLLRRKLAVVR